MRLNPRLLTGLVIALVSLSAGLIFWNRAFPIAGIQFELNESSAAARSRGFLEQAGFDAKGYFVATQFGEDSEPKSFIEKEYGIRQLEKSTRNGVNIWYWTTRFFKPEQEEEYTVAYDPQGRFVGFFRHIKENEPAPLLTREQARVVAEDFLKKFVTHHPFDKLKFVEDSSRKRPHRTDYYFTWEENDLRLGEAPYQLHVSIQGNRIGRFNETVKVPEGWSRKFSTQRSTNDFFESLAGYASLPILIGLAVLFIIYIIRHKIRWTGAVPARWLLLYGLVGIAAVFNDIPDILARYHTTQKWGSFVFSQLSSHAIAVLSAVGGMYLLSLIADAIYREKLPDKLPFSAALGKGALIHPETVRGLGVGIVLACFGVGYVSTFYVVAQHFGAWSPVDIDYSKILGGPIPWISGLQVGLTAAWSEEFIFRIVGILLYWKLFRCRWIGVILAGATWAFLHSNYPQMPGYLRGCELTVEGVLWGAVMLRYGIVATLTGHYLYDCWLSSYVVLQSPVMADKIGALAVSLWPVALWLIGLRYVREGHVLAKEDDESAVHAHESETAPAITWNYTPLVLTAYQRLLCFILAGAVFVAVWWGAHPDDPFADFGEISWSRQKIARAAEGILRDRGQDPATFRRIITLESNSLPQSEYLLEQMSVDDAADLFAEEWPDLVWHVRYFRFMQKEEFNLSLDKEGGLVNWQHDILQEAPGAALSKKEAQALAEKYLAETCDVDLSTEKLVDDDFTQQEHRRDYSFTWERTDWNFGEAKLRTSVDVQGNEPLNYDHFIKVPDEWYRDQQKKSGGWKTAVLGQISRWSGIGLSVLKFVAFIILVRKRVIPWKAGFLLALIPASLKVVDKLNDLPWFFSGYDTTTPVAHFVWETIGGDVAGIFLAWLVSGFWLNIIFGLLTWAFGWKLELLRWPELNWESLRRKLPDFVAIFLLSFAIVAVTDYFQEWVSFRTDSSPGTWFDSPSIDYAVPWLASLTSALQDGISTLENYAFAFSVAVIVHRRWPWLVWSALVIAPFYRAAHEETLREYFGAVAMGQFHWILTAFLVWKVWRFDVAMIFLFSALPSLWTEIDLFLEKGGPAYKSQSWPLIACAAILFLLAWWLRPSPSKTD